ncbi:MAG: hypothetical protein IPO26_21680 [Saprospiraceae bacterium]|nr:hypothetical protein [Saprospiraceae bacterium]
MTRSSEDISRVNSGQKSYNPLTAGYKNVEERISGFKSVLKRNPDDRSYHHIAMPKIYNEAAFKELVRVYSPTLMSVCTKVYG